MDTNTKIHTRKKHENEFIHGNILRKQDYYFGNKE